MSKFYYGFIYVSNLVNDYEDMKRFGEKLRTVRKQHGLTLIQLGDMLGVHHSHIGRIEQGYKRPSIDLVLKISRIFDVSIDQLMKDELELD